MIPVLIITWKRRTKVHHIPIKGFYDKGGRRSNKAEAQAIVNDIVHRLENEELRSHSIGVIAFSVMQHKTLRELSARFSIDEFGAWWLIEEDCRGYGNYRPDSGRDSLEIPAIEIINAVKEVLTEQVALNEDDLIIAGSRKLGFTRRGSNVEAVFRKAVEAMKASGTIESISDNLPLKES